MNVKKCSKLLLSASRNILHRFLTVTAVHVDVDVDVFLQYLSSIAALMSWSHQWMRACPYKLGVWPNPTGKGSRGCNKGNAEAKWPPTITKWFFQDGLEAVPSCCQTLTWPVTDEFLPAGPDHEHIDHQRSDFLNESVIRPRGQKCWPSRHE